MKDYALIAKCKRSKRIKTTDSNHNVLIAPGLLNRNFRVSRPDQLYVGDITHIKTKEGWLYLAVVIDLYARAVTGYAIYDHMKKALIVEALKGAYARRGDFKPKAIFHSDRGSHYASHALGKLLTTYGMCQSMGGKGHCYDNAVCESFFATRKTQLPFQTEHPSKKEATRAPVNYIDFYNTKRLHGYNNYLSPLEAEMVCRRNRLKVAAGGIDAKRWRKR